MKYIDTTRGRIIAESVPPQECTTHLVDLKFVDHEANRATDFEGRQALTPPDALVNIGLGMICELLEVHTSGGLRHVSPLDIDLLKQVSHGIVLRYTPDAITTDYDREQAERFTKGQLDYFERVLSSCADRRGDGVLDIRRQANTSEGAIDRSLFFAQILRQDKNPDNPFYID